jgi:hypothetical protein
MILVVSFLCHIMHLLHLHSSIFPSPPTLYYKLLLQLCKPPFVCTFLKCPIVLRIPVSQSNMDVLTLVPSFPLICCFRMSILLFLIRPILVIPLSHLHTPCVMCRMFLHCIGQPCWLKLVLSYMLNGRWTIQCSSGGVFYEYCPILASIA